MTGPILIASDGGRGCEGAVRMGAALARAKGREVRVLTVQQPIPMYATDGLAPWPEGFVLYETMQAETLRQAVARQVSEVDAAAADWPVVVEVGPPAPTIARFAREIGAEVILLGMGQHAPLDRWLGGETALKVGRLATTPVIAVPHDALGLPRRAMVAVDFSDFSLRAARAAARLMPEGGHLVLVHTTWPDAVSDPFPSLKEWGETYRQGVRSRLEEIAARLRSRHALAVECVVSAGDPAQEMLGLAARLNVDLIAAGSHGYGFLGRLMMGSVSTRLLRGAHCAVLIAPPEAAPEELRIPPTRRGEVVREPDVPPPLLPPQA